MGRRKVRHGLNHICPFFPTVLLERATKGRSVEEARAQELSADGFSACLGGLPSASLHVLSSRSIWNTFAQLELRHLKTLVCVFLGLLPASSGINPAWHRWDVCQRRRLLDLLKNEDTLVSAEGKTQGGRVDSKSSSSQPAREQGRKACKGCARLAIPTAAEQLGGGSCSPFSDSLKRHVAEKQRIFTLRKMLRTSLGNWHFRKENPGGCPASRKTIKFFLSSSSGTLWQWQHVFI